MTLRLTGARLTGLRLTEVQRNAAEAQVKFARDLGIFDFYRRPFDPATLDPATLDPANLGPATLDQYADEGSGNANPGAHHEAIENFSPDSSAELFQPSQQSDQQEQLIARAPISIISTLPSQPYTGSDKVAALHALQQEIGLCMRCPLALQGRNMVVFADGDPNAAMMFVGEGPGADEDVQGLPFVGKAGQLLNNMITAMGTTREQVYIANIVKCRPPKNRAPEPIEANTCLPFLLRQYDIVQPKIVVALGATAATYLTGMKVSLGSLRGRLHDFRQSKLLITYHPAFLLRDPRQKKEAWADLQLAMEYLGMKPAKA